MIGVRGQTVVLGMPRSTGRLLSRDRLAALAVVSVAVAMTVLSTGPLARNWSAIARQSPTLANAAADTASRGVPAGLQSAIHRALGPGAVGSATAPLPSGLSASTGGWTTADPAHALSETIARSGALTIHVRGGPAIGGLTARSIGSGAGAAGVRLHVEASASIDGRLVQRTGPLQTVYKVKPHGLEQSFVVNRTPATTGALLVLDLGRAAGWAVTDGGRSMTRRASSGTSLVYGGLETLDRSGSVVPSSMRIVSGTAEVVVHPTSSSLYPLTIDPTWSTISTPLATLRNPMNDQAQEFGARIALSADGTTALVGRPTTGVSTPDAAYIFRVSNEGSWTSVPPIAVLGTALTGQDFFGTAVALSADGTTAFIGSSDTNSEQGAVYVYHVASEGAWVNNSTPLATLTPSGGSEGEAFGDSVDVSGDGTTAIIGASGLNNGSGAAYIYAASSESTWSDSSTPSATLSDSAVNEFAAFGISVALSSDGSTGLVRIYASHSVDVFHVSSRTSWTNMTTPTATLTTPGDISGVDRSMTLSSDGSTALVGSNNNSVYVFHVASDAHWTTTSTPTATLSDAGTSSQSFGSAVSVSSNGATALIGAVGTNSNPGAAYVYEASNESSWTTTSNPSAALTNGSDTSDPGFGLTVTLSSDATTSVIGDAAFNGSQGQVYVFSRSQVPPAAPSPPAQPAPSHGYWLVGSDGGIFTFGSSTFWGSTGSLKLQRPVVGIVPTKDRGGYWLDASDGGVFSFGDTQFYGSVPGLGLHPAGSGLPNSLNAPIVGMVPSNDDNGYFMVASDGGVFAFGDARFAGSCPGIGGCSGTAVAVMPDHSGNGYWVVTSSGNIYTFGDAPYFGAPARGTVTSAVATPDGKGYWALLADGEVLGYGDAAGLGSPASSNFNLFDPAATIFATADGRGYWVSSALGKVFPFGDAPDDGDVSGSHLNGSIIAGSGY
jgi:hypothetical protein